MKIKKTFLNRNALESQLVSLVYNHTYNSNNYMLKHAYKHLWFYLFIISTITIHYIFVCNYLIMYMCV